MLMESAGKHVTDDKRDKTCITSVKRGKTCNRRQARQNMQPVSSAEKHVTDRNRGKRCNRWKARENM